MHLEAKDVRALLGRFNISDETEKHWVKRDIAKIIIHENSGMKSFADSNLALLKLEKDVKFTDFIIPIRLPSASENYIHVEGTIVGYGKLDAASNYPLTPRHADLRTIGPSECIETHENAPSVVSLENSFCANSNTSVPCRGKF